MLKTIPIIIFLLLSFYAKAQENCYRNIEGKIINNESKGVAFTSLTIVGFRSGTTCDKEGNFRFAIPCGIQTLKISQVGIKKTFVEIDSINNSFLIRVEDDTLIMGNGYLGKIGTNKNGTVVSQKYDQDLVSKYRVERDAIFSLVEINPAVQRGALQKMIADSIKMSGITISGQEQIFISFRTNADKILDSVKIISSTNTKLSEIISKILTSVVLQYPAMQNGQFIDINATVKVIVGYDSTGLKIYFNRWGEL